MNELLAVAEFIAANWRALFVLGGLALLTVIGNLWAWRDL